jgi:hypothetical protein
MFWIAVNIAIRTQHNDLHIPCVLADDARDDDTANHYPLFTLKDGLDKRASFASYDDHRDFLAAAVQLAGSNDERVAMHAEHMTPTELGTHRGRHGADSNALKHLDAASAAKQGGWAAPASRDKTDRKSTFTETYADTISWATLSAMAKGSDQPPTQPLHVARAHYQPRPSEHFAPEDQLFPFAHDVPAEYTLALRKERHFTTANMYVSHSSMRACVWDEQTVARQTFACNALNA